MSQPNKVDFSIYFWLLCWSGFLCCVVLLVKIGSILLKSLHSIKAIDSKYLDIFMKSISTPLSEIQHDIIEYGLGNMSKKIILKKYGHLRPGTYDILSHRYDESPDMYFDWEHVCDSNQDDNSKVPFHSTVRR